MAMQLTNESDDQLSSLWQAACTDYANETGTALNDEELQKLRGFEDLSRQLDHEKNNFEDFRVKRQPLLLAMQTVLVPFESFGNLIAGVVATAFPPASSIMGAMLLLVRATRKVSEAFDMIMDLFRKLGHFALRFDLYKGVPLSEGMKVIIVKVLVNILRVCAASQKLIRKGSLKVRFTKWAKNTIVEDTEVSSLLGELEELTSQEHMMVSAHGLNITHQALRNTEELLERDDCRRDQERLEKIKATLQPVSRSGQVFSFINENRLPGSGNWIEDRIRTWWQGTQPLLWLHGGPGVGKSYLASKIIADLLSGEVPGTAPLVAYFFCRNNDVDLRSINKALRTLAWQVATKSTSFATYVEEFCLKEDAENTYNLWRKLLLKSLVETSRAETCFVIDGLDEAEPEELDVLVSLIEKTFSDQLDTRPSLRIILLSRDSVRPVLEGHSLDWIPEVEVGNNENKDDLHQYISQKLPIRKFDSKPDLREEIVLEISREAEGLWEWANLVIEGVRRCRTKEQIQKVIKTTPRGISAMLNQELQRLSRELLLPGEALDEEYFINEGATQIDQFNMLLSFVTLAQKPLAVRQLNEALQIIFEEEVLNLEDDIRSLYSSLFQIRHDRDEYNHKIDVVILRHSSFYEHFRTSQKSGPIHVDVEQTEANFLYVILKTLWEVHKPEADRAPGDFYPAAIRFYADKFLASHLIRASPGTAGKRRGDISALFEDLFIQEKYMKWLVTVVQMSELNKYCHFPSSHVSNTAEFWLSAEDRITTDRRAEMVLNWLLPETRQRFEENARLSEDASDICPFTVLFSFIIRSWLHLWLAPSEIKEDDGWPAAIPYLLKLYSVMATVDDGVGGDSEIKDLLQMTWENKGVSVIMETANLRQFERTAMWHARVAQALLLHSQYEAAEQDLSVLHRDLARACEKTGRYDEALNHSQLAESTRLPRDNDHFDTDRIGRLLNLAQKKYRAKQREGAISTANEAWQEFLILKEKWRYPDFLSFFGIFLELRQLHRLKSVLDSAVEHFDVAITDKPRIMDFANYIFEIFIERPSIMYRVFQIVLKKNDQDSLTYLAKAMKRVDTPEQGSHLIGTLKYLLATILFDKGKLDLGIRGWCQVFTNVPRPIEAVGLTVNYRGRSLAHMVELCLSDAEIPSLENFPLMLDSTAEIGDACLTISSWLRNHGDPKNARHALRWQIKACIALLSDEEPTNNEDAFITLFKTFLIDPSSERDLGAALYWIKKNELFILHDYRNRSAGKLKGEAALLDSLGKTNLQEDSLDDFNIWFPYDGLTRCSMCTQMVESIHGWYFCLSCPYKSCCRHCSDKHQRDINNPDLYKCPGVCDDEHDFFFTGGFLRTAESVPEGMQLVVFSDGRIIAVLIQDWKDELAKKWETTDFAFDGGFSAWCMRVLPEPQRSRWAQMFNP